MFTIKFVRKNGQSLLNSDRLSLDPKTECNILDCLYTNVKLTTLAEESDADIEESCTDIMYQLLMISL